MLLLFIVSVLAQTDDEKCAAYITTLKHAVEDPSQLTALSPPTIMYSGKSLNDLGLYLVCRDQKDFRYIHLRMTTIAFMNHIGLCLPSYCHDEFLKTYNEETKTFINKQFQPAIKAYVTSADYQDPDNIYPDVDFGTVFVIILVIAVVMVNLAASVASVLINAKRKKFEKQQIKQQESIKYSAKYSVTDLECNCNTQLENQIVQDQEQGFMTGAKEQIEGKKFKEPTWNRVLKCFSFIDNIQKLFKIEPPSGPNESFVIFNGIRGISILWVMYGHEILNRMKVASNFMDVPYLLKQPGWITITPGAFFAVDVFFFIGGFLSAVLVLDKLLKMKRIPMVMVPSMWLHRFLRVWPLYAFCLLVYYKLMIYIGGGPIWSEYLKETKNCDGTWWRNLLFIDNMWAHGSSGLDYCYGWGWYLAVDFQIFLITPIILIIYCKSRKIGMGVFLTILFGSLILSYAIAWHKDYHFNMTPAGAKPQPDYQDVFYYKPWIRVSPYIFGILFGLLYRRHQANNSPTLNKITLQIKTHISIRIVMYIIGIALIQWMIWVVYPLQADMEAWAHQSQYLYQAFSKVIFVFGVALLITPALLGIKNDPVRVFCGHPAWVPLARISFAMYLTHFAVILFTTFSSTQINYYQHSHAKFLMISDLFYTLIVSTLVSVAVEVPCMQLEKILFEPRKKPQTQLIQPTKTADAL